MNDYERIAGVIRYLDAHRLDQPDLVTVASQAGLSPHYFHRLFTAWAGVTPKDFLQCLTLAEARRMLASGKSVLDAALAAGLSGPGRLHDLCVTLESASPGELKEGGAHWTIEAGFAESPFGRCLLATSPRGICHLAFLDAGEEEAAWEELERDWPNARLQRNDAATLELVTSMFASAPRPGGRPPWRALVRGTEFQVRVWRALIQIPPGQLINYGSLAAWIGYPTAARAVGAAVGRNSVSYLIPCHRVIRETGVIGEYRWGASRKRAMIAWESARARGATEPVSAGDSAAHAGIQA